MFQMQLRHERTEERRKLFKIAEKRQNVADIPLSKWKKILPALPQARTELSRNSEITRKDNVQVAIENLSYTIEGKRTNDTEKDSSRHEQISDSCNNEKQIQEGNDSELNDISSNKRYNIFKIIGKFMNLHAYIHAIISTNYKSSLTSRPINFVGHSWDSQSSEQSVIPEIQLNDEESAHGSVELNNASKGCNQET